MKVHRILSRDLRVYPGCSGLLKPAHCGEWTRRGLMCKRSAPSFSRELPLKPHMSRGMLRKRPDSQLNGCMVHSVEHGASCSVRDCFHLD
jgi:hypothetical protein